MMHNLWLNLKLISFKWLIINRKKIEWETFDTSKIKTVFFSSSTDFGTKIRYKCHRPIPRRKRTLDGESCSNWQLIDSFGVRLADVNSNSPMSGTKNYENFYAGFKKEEIKNEEIKEFSKKFDLYVQSFSIIFIFVYYKFLFELDLKVDEQFITLKKPGG